MTVACPHVVFSALGAEFLLRAAAFETSVTPLFASPAAFRTVVSRSSSGGWCVAGRCSLDGNGFLAFLYILEFGGFE